MKFFIITITVFIAWLGFMGYVFYEENKSQVYACSDLPNHAPQDVINQCKKRGALK